MQNTDQPEANPAASAAPSAGAQTPAKQMPPPKKGGIGKRIPPQHQQGGKGFVTHPSHDNQSQKFKPVRSNAVKFIQARRAPGA